MFLSIMAENPILAWQVYRLGVLLHLIPIRLMPHIARCLSSFLHSTDTIVPVLMSETMN